MRNRLSSVLILALFINVSTHADQLDQARIDTEKAYKTCKEVMQKGIEEGQFPKDHCEMIRDGALNSIKLQRQHPNPLNRPAPPTIVKGPRNDISRLAGNYQCSGAQRMEKNPAVVTMPIVQVKIKGKRAAISIPKLNFSFESAEIEVDPGYAEGQGGTFQAKQEPPLQYVMWMESTVTMLNVDYSSPEVGHVMASGCVKK